MLITDWFHFQVALLVLQCCELTISMAIFICKQYLQDWTLLHSKPQAYEDRDGWTSVQFMTCWTSSEEVKQGSSYRHKQKCNRNVLILFGIRNQWKNTKIQHSLSYVRCMTHTYLKKVKINEKCYEQTIIALTDVPIRQMYLLSELIWSPNTYKGQIENVLKGWLCWVPVSGSVARTTTTDVPIPAVSLSPRRLYCDWVKTGDSSFTSSTYTITYRHKLTITVWFTTHTCCYTHIIFSTCL